MKFVSLSTLIAPATFALTASAQFSTNFEAPDYTSGVTIAGQQTWTSTNPDRARVLTASEIAAELATMGVSTDETVFSGSQALFVSGIGSSSSSFSTLSGLGTEEIIRVNAYARPLTSTVEGSNLGNIFLTLEDAGGVRAAAVRFGADGIDYHSNNTWMPPVGDWNADSWYQLTMDVDYSTDTYNVFVDGVMVNQDPIPFYNAASTSPDRIRVFRGSNQAGMIVDDLSVTVVPEPGTLSLFAIGAGAMLIRRRNKHS